MEQRLRAFDTEILEVGKRRFAEHRFAAALQCACARRQRVGGFLQREPVLEVVARPPLEAQNERIGLRQMIGYNLGNLRRAYVGEQVT